MATVRVIGEGMCVGTVEGLFQIHRGQDLYYVKPHNTEGPCGPGQRVWLVERDGVIYCSAMEDDDGKP